MPSVDVTAKGEVEEHTCHQGGQMYGTALPACRLISQPGSCIAVCGRLHVSPFTQTLHTLGLDPK
jgi:hypothetical protein